ncbi:MAG: hypothetical protein JKY37_12305 [Nannocystaceae bacterium]|nr:hypothetical protein [Nannocystaceae bacterium]
MKIIVSVLGGLLLAALVVSLATQGNAWLTLMIFLGATIGPPMLMSADFTADFKTLAAIGLMLAAGGIVIGLRKRDVWWGQLAAVVGVVGWTMIGLIGLGTGT